MEEINLTTPVNLMYGFDEASVSAGVHRLRILSFLDELRKNGFAYIKIKRGDYKGSIVKFIPDKNEFKDPKIVRRFGFSSSDKFFLNVESPYGRYKWDGLKNNIAANPIYDGIWLKDYEGPTELQKIDKKAARTDLIKSTEFLDVNGNKLQVGDPVTYVDIQYGNSIRIERGKIDHFDAKVNAHTKETFVVVSNDRTGHFSKIKAYDKLIMKGVVKWD